MAKKKTPKNDEIAELERAYESMTGPQKTTKKTSSLSTLVVVLTLVFVVLVGGFLLLIPTIEPREREEMRLSAVTAAGVNLEGMTIEEARQALEQATFDTYSQTDMVILVDDEEYRLSPAQSGVQLNIDSLLTSAEAGLPIDTLDYLNLDTDAIDALLTQLDETYNAPAGKTTCVFNEETKEITITLGTVQTGLDIPALKNAVMDAYRANKFRIRQDCSMLEPDKVDLDALYAQYHVDAVDAVMDMTTFEVSLESSGVTFDLEAAKYSYYSLSYGESMTIQLVEVLPEVTQEALASVLFRDVLASYRTRHTWDPNRTENLRLASAAIHELILMPGDQFQYNAALGERTKEKGYKTAGAYINGETVDTIGGGICQVSSTLYYCALIADLQIDKRFPHSYVSSYMPMGMDATVSWGGPDFWFTNNTAYPIRIEAWVEDGYVNIQLIGTDEKDYYIEMEYEILERFDYETVYEELPPDNEKGLVDGDVMTTPYTGYSVKTYKCRYDKETGVLISRDFEANSIYKKRDEVICKIVDPNAPTDPTDPSDPTDPTDPTQPTETPTEPTEVPTEPTETPTEPTEVSTEPTEASTEPTEASTEPTETPSEPTQAPTEATQASTESTE